MKIKLLIVILISVFSNAYTQTDELRSDILKLIETSKTKTGLSLYSFNSGDTLSINGDEFFPMQSVYKFHIAFAILNMADKKELNINDEIFINKSDLKEDTWSPLRDKHPEGNVKIKISELLRYSVSESDNNACDILINMAGGTDNIQKYFDSIGLKDFFIETNEFEMQKDWETQFRNKTTPKSATESIKKIYTDNLFSKESFNFLYDLMTNSKTGQKRIKEKLPAGTIIAHKTGTSGKNKDGMIAAVNDIAFISLPNGQKYILSIFVSDSFLDYTENEKLISDISVLVYNYFNK